MSSPLLSAKELSISLGGRKLFDNVSMSIHEGSRIALVGPNGVGKSTLLRVLSGELQEDSGELTMRRGLLVEYVPQFLPGGSENKSLYQFLAEHILSRSTQRPAIDEWHSYATLESYGFSESDADKSCGVLSGGEVNRLLLARAMVVQPDVLLLDEPTNHLDSEAIIRFERFVKEIIKIPFCLVSHDRELIDTVTNETVILRDGAAHHFRIPLSEARQQLQHRDQIAEDKRRFEEEEIVRLEKAARDLQAWAKLNPKFSGRLHNMQKRVVRAKSNLTQTAKADNRVLGVSSKHIDADSLVTLSNLPVVVGGDKKLYQIPKFNIAPGDRVAILGRNGAGKTSLLNLLVSNFSSGKTQSSCVFNPRTKIGYYDQELRALDGEKSIVANITSRTNCSEDRIVKELVKAGFNYTRHHGLVKNLSGGEKSRLQFLILKLCEPTLYLLDEPTNHIDLLGMEQLEEQLTEDTSLTCIFVSHDRRFVESIANKMYLIRDGIMVEIADIEEYYEIIDKDVMRVV